MDKWEEKQNRLTVLLEKRATEAITREEAKEIHELQKQLWAHNKNATGWPKRCLSQQMFGKRICDMTREERAEYEHVLYSSKSKHRKREESITRTTIGKPIKEMSKEELAEYRATLTSTYKKKQNPYAASLSRQMFGKRFRDLNEDELRQYREALSKRRNK